MRLRRPDISNMRRRRVRRDFIAAFQCLWGCYQKRRNQAIHSSAWWGERDNRCKLKGEVCTGYEKLFTMRAVRQRSRLSEDIVQAPSTEIVRAQLHKARGSVICPQSWPCFEQEVGLDISWGCFHPERFFDTECVQTIADRTGLAFHSSSQSWSVGFLSAPKRFELFPASQKALPASSVLV